MSLSAFTTEELAAELVRRGTTYAGSVRLVSWSDTSKGSFTKFALNRIHDGELILTESPFKGCAEGVKDGQEFFATFTMIQNSPLPPVENNGPEHSVDAGGRPVTEKDAGRERQSWGELPYVQRAGMLAQDQRFWKYTQSDSEDSAAKAIRLFCCVASRKDITPGSEAAERFDQLYQGFRDFTFMEGRQWN